MATKKKPSFGLVVTVEEVATSLKTLSAYIQERKALVETKQITDVQTGVKLMAAVQDFAAMVGSMAKAPAEILYNNIRFTLIPTLMDEADITTIGVDGVGKCHLQDDITVKVTDAEGLKNWLTEQGSEDLITETVNAQTLAAYFRARMKANAEAVDKAMKAGTTDPEKLQELQEPLPSAQIVDIKPIVRAQLKRE